MTPVAEDAWFAVSVTVVDEMVNQPCGPHMTSGTGEIDYEERITLWRAPSVDAAPSSYAEAEAARYVEDGTA